MRICVDASPLLFRSVGVKTYFYHWLQHLRRATGKDVIRGFPWIGNFGELDHESSQISFLGTCVRRGMLAAANQRIPGALELLVPQADIFHASNQLHNPPKRMPLTSTMQDFTTRLFPEFHTERNIRDDRNFAEAVLKNARGLIAISENTRSDAVRLLYLDPEKIEVIYPGVSEAYFCIGNRTPERAGRPYILFFGTIEPRKNIDLLLQAYGQLPDALRREFELVIVGRPGWKSTKTMARLKNPPAGVRYLGYVPESKMPELVSGATIVAYPSLYEGFGLPVAEAMACGVPVITSAVSSLPEVAGNAAVLIDPRSVGELRSALESLLSNDDLRKKLAKCGAARAREYFRWPLCAERSMAFFRKVIGS